MEMCRRKLKSGRELKIEGDKMRKVRMKKRKPVGRRKRNGPLILVLWLLSCDMAAWKVDTDGSKQEEQDTERDTAPNQDGRRTTNCLKTGWKVYSGTLETKDLKNWGLAAKTRNRRIKTINGNTKNSISILHWNLGNKNWENKILEVQAMVDELTPDVCFISEANLFNDKPDHLCMIEGYNLTKAKTTISLGYSRLVLLTKIGLVYTLEDKRMEEGISSIWLKVGGRGRKAVLICGVYREHKLIRQEEPNFSGNPDKQLERWTKIVGQWSRAGNVGSVVLIGDTNIDILKWDEPEFLIQPMVDLINEEIITQNFSQMIQGPTRFWKDKSPSLLDQCWSNDPARISNIRNIPRGTADHNVVAISFRMAGKVTSSMETVTRDWANFEKLEFKRRMALADWGPVFLTENVNIANWEFLQIYLQILDELAPKKRFQPRNKISKWVSPQTKRKMVERDSWRQRAVESSREEDWAKYRETRNQVTRDLRTDRRDHKEKVYRELQEKKDSKGLYRMIKNLAGWKSGGTPEAFLLNGRMTRNPREMAEIQASAFSDKVKNLLNKMPPPTGDPMEILTRAIQRWEGWRNVPELGIQPVGRQEIVELLKKLGTSHSFGHDGMDGASLSIVAEEVANPVRHIVNLSIVKGEFAQRWKIGRVIPLHKGGTKPQNDPQSFRPISLLPTLSKVTEKVVQTQLIRHLEINRMMNINVHSYRHGHSTTTALIEICDKIFEASDEREVAVAMAIDESSAFDLISHELLLKKMKLYKCNERTLKWMSSYLDSRSQYVSIGGQDSTIRRTEHGVPQGSILGPILFNLFVNDMPDVCNKYGSCNNSAHLNTSRLFSENCKECGNVTIFADDAVYVNSNKSRENNQIILQTTMDRLREHLINSRMAINTSKTIIWELMLKQKLCKLRGSPPTLRTTMDNGDIKIVRTKDSNICLGGTIQKDLQWKAQLETGEKATLPILRKKLGILKHVGRHVPRNGKLLLANGIILGKLNYLMVLYGGTQEKYLVKLQVLCNNVIRFVTGASRRTSTRTLVKSVGWLTIKEMICYNTLVTAWKIVWMETPGLFRQRFELDDDKTLQTKNPRLLNTSLSVRWRVKTEWNKLPNELKNIRNLIRFKTRIKKWITENRTPEPGPGDRETDD